MSTAIIAVVTAFAGTLVLTPLARLVSARLGMVAQPRPDRWAAKPTAKLGGAAMFVAVNIALVVSGVADRRTWTIMIACAAMFVLGLIDDLFPLRPHHKLVLQTIPSVFVIMQGVVLPWTNHEIVNIGFTVLWLVGITNAINLLDNMDGLAAGIAAVASITLAVTFVRTNQFSEAIVIATLFASLLAFLIFNFHPASIFMGDCGSLFIGFYVASVALLTDPLAGGRSRSLLPAVFVPVVILLIPIFDTAFVAFVRKLAGRPSMMGGLDHTSHRLVALGLNERTAVLLLYALALVAGAVGILSRDLPFDVSIALSGAVAILLAILGFYLAGVKVYEPSPDDTSRPLTSFLVDLSYRRRVFEVLLDLILITYAYYLAYRLHFGPPDGGPDWRRFIDSLPIVLAVKMAMFLFSGIYGGIWRYMSVEDALVFVKAVAGSSIAVVLVLVGLWRFHGLSRIAFVMDGLILFVLVAATRSSFRIFETLTKRARSADRGVRTLIYGAGDAGELLLRELRGNRPLGLEAAAFFDDDPRKAGKAIRGLPVHGGDFEQVCVRESIAEVVLSTTKLPPKRLQEIAAICRRLDLPLRQLTIAIVPVTPFPRQPRTGEEPETEQEMFGATAPDA